jgi:TolB-like protein
MRARRSRNLTLAALLAALLLSPGGEARPEGGRTRPVAVLPFAMRGGTAGAWARVAAALGEALAARGVAPVDAARVERELRARRLRDLSLLTRAEIAGLAEALGAERLLLGVVYRFDEIEPPAVSLSARLLDPRSLALEASAFVSVEGRSLLGPLGSGGPVSADRALREAARRLADALAAPRGGPAFRRRAPRLSVLAPAPATFVSSRLAGRPVTSVVVLPFRNLSREPGAGQAAAELGSWCLHALSPVVVLDAGDATRRLLGGGWRTGMPVGRPEVQRLGREPAADAVLMGSVERWEEGDASGLRPPEIGLSLRLLDAATGDILWMAEHERHGSQTRTFYEAGNVRRAEALMALTACEALVSLTGPLVDHAPLATGGTTP